MNKYTENMAEHQNAFFLNLEIGSIIPLPTYFDEQKKLHDRASASFHAMQAVSSKVLINEDVCYAANNQLFADQASASFRCKEAVPSEVMIIDEDVHYAANNQLFADQASASFRCKEAVPSEVMLIDEAVRYAANNQLFADQASASFRDEEAVPPQAIRTDENMPHVTASGCAPLCLELIREPLPPVDTGLRVSEEIPVVHLNSGQLTFEELIEQLIGDEEEWFTDTHQSEELWFEQLPECADVAAPDQNSISVQLPPESVVKTQIDSRSAQDIGSVKSNPQTVITHEGGISQNNTALQQRTNNVTASTSTIKKGSCDNVDMVVTTTSSKETKKLCCTFCLKLFSKLARHLEDMHKKERDVQLFMQLPKGSKERHDIQDNLRKSGTYKFNTDAELNKGRLIVSRRPNENRLATDYKVCPYCLGFYVKTNLRHHVASCQKNPELKSRILKNLAVMIEGRIHSDASTRLVHVMSFMREDLIVRLIRYDWLLIVFGNKLCCKYTPHYQENMIRARLRLAGRLLFEMKKIDSTVTDFASIYHVERYVSLVAAIKLIGRFDSETNEFGAPAMAACAVTFVKQIGKYLCAEYIRLRDRENKMETEDFIAYMETDIGISINKLVTETQAKMRRRKQENIPTMADVKILMTYVNVELSASFETLSKNFSEGEWIRLAQLIVAWIIVFNRKRVGEVQNITVEEYLCRQCVDEDSNKQMMSSLSEDAKKMARKFKRMKIRGKLGRPVPVLLKPIVDKAIQLLISNRQAAGISADRLFLFELPSSCALSIRIINACEVLRNLSIACGATNPSSLRGTTLRKHMATTCISLELNDAIISELADFMGHSEKIHRTSYRKNPLEREVVQIAQVLEAAVGHCDDDDDDDGCDCQYCCDGNVVHGAQGSNSVDVLANNVLNKSMDLDDADSPMMTNDPEFRVEERSADSNDVQHKDSQKKFTKRRWTNEEISIVRREFAVHLRNGTLPLEPEIMSMKSSYPALNARSWQMIKTWISNQKKKPARVNLKK